jgi:hypothetical protein
MPEQTSVGYVTHQKLDNDEKLVYSLVKTRGCLWRRSPSDSLLQISVRRTVIKLYCFDSTQVIVIASELGVTRRRREGRFRNKFVGLIVEAVMDITSQEPIYKRGLSVVIVPEGCGALSRQEKSVPVVELKGKSD